MTTITMLGTGNAMVTKCYNTCFAIRNEQGTILVDAGGGNGIMVQLERAGIDWKTISMLYLTHAHTDHILGVIWVIRKINAMIKSGKYTGDFRIYGLKENLDFLRNTCDFMIWDPMSERIHFEPIVDGTVIEHNGITFTAFDIHSTKMNQMGFKAVIPMEDGTCRQLVCLGDEPYNELCRKYVENADWLMCEAFCLYEDREMFKPYEKHHSTALDAGRMAQSFGIKNLVMYHTEDTRLLERKRLYAEEARHNFSGSIYVPDDLDIITIG